MLAHVIAVLTFIDDRLGEASTWSAAAAFLVALHVNVDPGVWHAITLWGAMFAAGLGFVIKEVNDGKSARQTAQDILRALIELTNKVEGPKQ